MGAITAAITVGQSLRGYMDGEGEGHQILWLKKSVWPERSKTLVCIQESIY
jgi:hypothetical protein